MSRDDETIIIDVWLCKKIGLYQLLNSDDGVVGTFREWYRTAALVSIRLMFVTYVVQIVGLFFSDNDFTSFIYSLTLIFVGLMTAIKGYTFVKHSDQLWSIAEIAGYGFTRSGRRDPTEMVRCKKTLSLVLRLYVILNYSTLFTWLMAPVYINDQFRTNKDGTVSLFRTTIYDFWIPFYRQPYMSFGYAAVYMFEAYVCCLNVFIWTIYDSYVMTMCFVLNANFRTVASGYGKVGWSGKYNRQYTLSYRKYIVLGRQIYW